MPQFWPPSELEFDIFGSGGITPQELLRAGVPTLDGWYDQYDTKRPAKIATASAAQTPKGMAVGPDGRVTIDPAAVKAALPGAGVTIWDKVSDYFGRAIIIVLGFIFVAVGLSMFKGDAANILRN